MMKRISLEMAQDIGLVPEPNGYVTTPLGLGSYFSEDIYRCEERRIIKEKCIDQNLWVCEFDKEVICKAIERKKNRGIRQYHILRG